MRRAASASPILFPEEFHMYLLFVPSTIAIVVIGFIQLREQFGASR